MVESFTDFSAYREAFENAARLAYIDPRLREFLLTKFLGDTVLVYMSVSAQAAYECLRHGYKCDIREPPLSFQYPHFGNTYPFLIEYELPRYWFRNTRNPVIFKTDADITCKNGSTVLLHPFLITGILDNNNHFYVYYPSNHQKQLGYFETFIARLLRL